MSKHYKRKPTAVVTFDYLWEEGDTDDDEVGRAWNLDDEVATCEQVIAYAYDDDGERYYKLAVILPVDDNEDALTHLLAILMRHAGVTEIRFPGRPDLDVG